jgi:hypothetical protein
MRWALISRLVQYHLVTLSGDDCDPAVWRHGAKIVGMLAPLRFSDGMTADAARAIRA